MTRKDFLEWLDTHPTGQWAMTHVDDGRMRVLFWFDEEESTEEEEA